MRPIVGAKTSLLTMKTTESLPRQQKEVLETVQIYNAVVEVAAQYDDNTLQRVTAEGVNLRIEEIPILVAALEQEMKDLVNVLEFESTR